MMKKDKKLKAKKSEKEGRDLKSLRFIDESFLLDKELQLIGSLSEVAGRHDKIDAEMVQEIGLSILSYLERRTILESFFYGRRLPFHMDEVKQRAEFLRLRLIYGRGNP